MCSEQRRALVDGFGERRRRRAGPDSRRDARRDLVPCTGIHALDDTVVRQDQDSMLEQGDENQNTRASGGGEDALFDESLRSPRPCPAREHFVADEPPSEAFEPAHEPAREEAELEPDQQPQVVGCSPAAEKPHGDGRASRSYGAADERPFPSHLWVWVATLDDVHDELAGRPAFGIRRSGANGFAILVRKEGCDSACHDPR